MGRPEFAFCVLPELSLLYRRKHNRKMWSIQQYSKTNFIGMRWLSSWMDSWFCSTSFREISSVCVMTELLQYSGTLLKSGASIVFSKMHWKKECNSILNNDLWDIAYVTGFRETRSNHASYKVWQKFHTSGNTIWLVPRGLTDQKGERPKWNCKPQERVFNIQLLTKNLKRFLEVVLSKKVFSV